jgi:hypothetical protein
MRRLRGIVLVVAFLGLAANFAYAGSGTGLWDWYLVPAAASNPGVYPTYWRLDLWVHNPYSWRSVSVRIWFLREKTDNSTAPHRDFVIGPAGQLALPDVVGNQFGVTGKGALLLNSTDGAHFSVNARSYTTSPNGTYGHEVQGQEYTVRGGERAFTPGIRVGEGYRTNVGVVNATSRGISVLAEALDSSGSLRGSYTFNLYPWSSEQLAVTTFAPEFGAGAIRWTCLSSGSDVDWVAYATPVDNVSGDAIYLEERRDDRYTMYRPSWNLSGRWQGSLSFVGGGGEQVTADFWQDGARVTGNVYDTLAGFLVMKIVGYENLGSLVFSGTPYVLQTINDSLWGSATVTSSAGIAGTFSGTGYYASGGSFALSKSYSFAPQQAQRKPEGARGHLTPAAGAEPQ